MCVYVCVCVCVCVVCVCVCVCACVCACMHMYDKMNFCANDATELHLIHNGSCVNSPVWIPGS